MPFAVMMITMLLMELMNTIVMKMATEEKMPMNEVEIIYPLRR